MLTDLIEEMKAKVSANCGMLMSVEEVKEVLAALTSPAEVRAAALGVEAKKETLPPAEDESVADGDLASDDEPDPSDEPQPKKGPLPDDFPGRAALAGAAINTFAQVRKARDSKEGLKGITGIGDATANAIEEALS